jgi:hypothetical protein
MKRFDLDHIRAHVGHHLRGVWPLNELTEICDAQSF